MTHTVIYWWLGGMALMLLANLLLANVMGATMFVPFVAFTGFAGPVLRRHSPVAPA